MKFFKSVIKQLIRGFLWILTKFSAGRFIHKLMLLDAMNATKKVPCKDINLKFSVPNTLNNWRVDTFASKEPETLEWIDNFTKDSVFWDVGANVGLYSCYAAYKKNCEVVAFEPSVFNLELLARNISNNSLTDNISIMPLAISDKKGKNALNLTTTEWGGALSTFGETYGQDGKELDIDFCFNTFGVSLDMVRDMFNLNPPTYIKIDVDGIEHLILSGARDILSNAKGVLVEINETFMEQLAASSAILQEAGFKLAETHKLLMAEDLDQANQIWFK